MKRFALRWVVTLALLAPAGLATAQVNLRGAQTSSGLPAASVATTPSRTGVGMAGTAEPKSMSGMLAAQNDVRARLNLAPLAWSGELMTQAEATAATAADTGCSQSTAAKAGAASQASMFWAPAIRRMDGAGMVQDIIPSYLVSQWKAGRADYDAARLECRKSGACQEYARMVSPGSRAVGCAKLVCSSQAQVWACQYSDGKPAATPAPAQRPPAGLRPRQGD
jgi:hypothetical protein